MPHFYNYYFDGNDCDCDYDYTPSAAVPVRRPPQAHSTGGRVGVLCYLLATAATVCAEADGRAAGLVV